MMESAEYESPEVVMENSSRSSDMSLDTHLIHAHDALKSLKQEFKDDGDVEVYNRVDLSLSLMDMLIQKPNSSSEPSSLSHSMQGASAVENEASSSSSRWPKQETEDSMTLMSSMPRRQMPSLPPQLMHSSTSLSRLLDNLLNDPRSFDALAKFIDSNKQKLKTHSHSDTYTVPTLQTKVEDGIVTCVIFFYENDPLPQWNREVYLRLHGKTAGKNDIRYASIDLNHRFRTRPELQQALQKRSIPAKEQELFDFSAPFCVCQRPSDHNNKLDTFIECSFGRCGCNAWIHPQCVGLGRLSSKQVSSLKRVVCPYCTATLSAHNLLEQYFPSTHYLHLKHLTMGYKRVVYKQEDDSLIEASNLWHRHYGLPPSQSQEGGRGYEVKEEEYDYSAIWQKKVYPDKITPLLLSAAASSSSGSGSVIGGRAKEDSKPQHRLIGLLADDNDSNDNANAMNNSSSIHTAPVATSRKRSSAASANATAANNIIINPALQNNRHKRNRYTTPTTPSTTTAAVQVIAAYSPPSTADDSNNNNNDYDANYDFIIEYPEYITRRRLYITHPNPAIYPPQAKLKLGVIGGYLEEGAVATRVIHKSQHRGSAAVVKDWGQGDILLEMAMRLALPPRSRSTSIPQDTTIAAAAASGGSGGSTTTIPLLLLPSRDGGMRTVPAWASHPRRLDFPSSSTGTAAAWCMLCLKNNHSGVHVKRTLSDTSNSSSSGEEVVMHVQCAMIFDKQQWLSQDMKERLDEKIIVHGLYTGQTSKSIKDREEKKEEEDAMDVDYGGNHDADDNKEKEDAEEDKKPSTHAATRTVTTTSIDNEKEKQQRHDDARCLLCCREGGIKLSVSFSSAILTSTHDENESMLLHVPCLLQLAMMFTLLDPLAATSTDTGNSNARRKQRLSTAGANAAAVEADDDDGDDNEDGMDIDEGPIEALLPKSQAKSLLDQLLHHNGRCSVCESHRGLVLRCGAIGCQVRAHLICLALQPQQQEDKVTMGEVSGVVCMLCSVHAPSYLNTAA